MKKIFTILGLTAIATINAQIVINEVYSGGGATTGTPSYKNDFVELVNIGSSAQSLSGATLQYSASGASSTFNSYVAIPDFTLQPGQKYLVELLQIASGSNVILGADLPAPADFVATNNVSLTNGNTYPGGLAMAGVNGRIALASNNTRVDGVTAANVLDFVGYGSSTLFEGSGAAPALSTVLSAQRIALADTNNNATDFQAATPTPQNSTALAVSDVNGKKINLVKNSNVKNTIVFGAKANVQIISANGQVVKTASVSENTNLDVSSLPKGLYIISADVNGQKVSQKVIKN
jgi:hypothetical protein